MQTLLNCPVCGGIALNNTINCRDFVASDDSFTLQRCAGCTFLFTNPRPDENEIGKYYQSDKYVSHTGKKSGLIYRIYDVVRNFSIRSKLRLIKKHHKGGRLLDLGCGLGDFLYGAKKDNSFGVVGVDISDDAVAYVHKNFGLVVKKEAELETFLNHEFDVITQWHVLEHVHLLNERMQQLKRILKVGGTMFVAVPNSNSWDSKNYREFWDGYDAPRHLYHFNRKSFRLLMEKHSFEVIKERPLWFDAPYVCMRSEVHKGNKILAFVFGAFSGAYSNFLAVFSGNYSSVLFVVKNK